MSESQMQGVTTAHARHDTTYLVLSYGCARPRFSTPPLSPTPSAFPLRLRLPPPRFTLSPVPASSKPELLGFGQGDYVSEPVVEALLDPQQPSDPPRRHMAVTAESLPPPLVRPHWMRILWGPPAMEIARGGDLRVEVRMGGMGEGGCTR